jgi:hypothetical protein
MSELSATEADAAPGEWRADLPTVVAIALVAYALANVAHEGIGHGGACLLAGSKPLVLSSVHFECDDTALSEGGRRLVAAGGTLVNLLVGLAAALGLRAWRGGAHGRFFLWLLATLDLFQAAGYFLFSGIGNIGDWAAVIRGLRPGLAWHAALVLLGGVAYVGVARAAAGWLAPLLGAEQRVARARRLAVPSYLAGGLLYCASGLLNPLGPLLLFISAAAASFGGASGLLWFHEWLRGDRIPLSPSAMVLDRQRGWWVAGALTALVFVFVLGPSVRF